MLLFLLAAKKGYYRVVSVGKLRFDCRSRRMQDSYLTNKEASTVLCSVVKHAGSGRARKKCRGKHETKSSVLPHFLSALPLPACFTTEQSTVEASLFVL